MPELFADGAGWSPLASPGPWPQYAHLFLLEDAKAFYTGGQYGGNNGSEPSIWDLETRGHHDCPEAAHARRAQPVDERAAAAGPGAAVMIIDGGGYDMHNMAPAIADVAVADLSAPAPAYLGTESLHMARVHLNAVLLPDRTVLVSGGAMMEEAAAEAAFDAEIFDPQAGTWAVAAAARVPRLYHSIALLMPDGKVVTAGSNPERTQEELRIEVFWPPYLFRGQRPECIRSADQSAYDSRLDASAPNASRLRDVNLIRPGATTHSADNEQRLLDVPFDITSPNSIELRLPTNRDLAPPGWYMVFAVDTDGVPSTAS